MGEGTEIELPGIGGSVGSHDFEQFKKKAERFLKDHLANDIVAKVRNGDPITAADMQDLQRVLVAAGIGDKDTFAEATMRAGSFGLFVRSLVGLDRAAAKRVFARFLNDKRYSVNLNQLRQPGHQLPHRAWHHPTRPHLRVTIHQRRTRRPRNHLRQARPRRILQDRPTNPRPSRCLISHC